MSSQEQYFDPFRSRGDLLSPRSEQIPHTTLQYPLQNSPFDQLTQQEEQLFDQHMSSILNPSGDLLSQLPGGSENLEEEEKVPPTNTFKDKLEQMRAGREKLEQQVARKRSADAALREHAARREERVQATRQALHFQIALGDQTPTSGPSMHLPSAGELSPTQADFNIRPLLNQIHQTLRGSHPVDQPFLEDLERIFGEAQPDRPAAVQIINQVSDDMRERLVDQIDLEAQRPTRAQVLTLYQQIMQNDSIRMIIEMFSSVVSSELFQNQVIDGVMAQLGLDDRASELARSFRDNIVRRRPGDHPQMHNRALAGIQRFITQYRNLPAAAQVTFLLGNIKLLSDMLEQVKKHFFQMDARQFYGPAAYDNSVNQRLMQERFERNIKYGLLPRECRRVLYRDSRGRLRFYVECQWEKGSFTTYA